VGKSNIYINILKNIYSFKVLKGSGVKQLCINLAPEQLIEVYKEAINLNVSKDFIILLSEEINKRLITDAI
jgi:hypothetical protein